MSDEEAELFWALDAARNHIGWLWEIVEENTRLRREGSEHVLRYINEARDKGLDRLTSEG